MNTVTEITRRAIIGCFSRDNKWTGILEDAEFLSRLYDLKKMPSKDNRFADAYKDVWQNRTYKDNWVDDWVFTDERFNLLSAPDDVFLKFLCETVNPQVRPDEKAAEELIAKFNAALKADGWELFRKQDAAGGPILGARMLGSTIYASGDPRREKVSRHIQEMRFILRTAVAEGDYHNIVLISLDTFDALAEAAFDAGEDMTINGKPLSEMDAATRIKALLEQELKGDTNKETLAYARAALKLALSLQKTSNFDHRTAAVCVEATASLVNLISVLTSK